MLVACPSHTWFVYNLNTIFIRCEHTCAAIHIRTALSWTPFYWPIPPPASLLAHLQPPAWVNHPFLLTWRSLFWWSWCKYPSTLAPGWWSTAHPLRRNPPPPFPTAPTVHVTCLQRQHHNISYSIWYIYVPLSCLTSTQRHPLIIFPNTWNELSEHDIKSISNKKKPLTNLLRNCFWIVLIQISNVLDCYAPFVTFQTQIKLLVCELTDLLLDVAVFSAIMSCSVIVGGCVSVLAGLVSPLSDSPIIQP